MNVLEKIVAHKAKEIEQAKALVSVKELEQSPLFAADCFSAVDFIRQPERSGVIAEFKRQSPSKGIINDYSSVEQVTQGYNQAGASVLSVLTDRSFFGGSDENLRIARASNEMPILRKDFIIEEYQILEAKAMGADVVLLIAACLDPKKLKSLAQFAQSLGLQVLLEVHNEQELEESLNDDVDLAGVNNRDLTTFTTTVETSYRLGELIPDHFVNVSESGIHAPKTVVELKQAGYEAFLIGENFMKEKNPAQACRQFVEEIRQIEKGGN